jgi:hypothetical protein
MRSSSSWEVRILASIAGTDAGSVTGKNLRNLQAEFSLWPWTNSVETFKKSYRGYQVPGEDSWRMPLLGKLLEQRREMFICEEDTITITGLIESLCMS